MNRTGLTNNVEERKLLARKENLNLIATLMEYEQLCHSYETNGFPAWARVIVERAMKKAGFQIPEDTETFHIIVRMNWILTFDYGKNLSDEQLFAGVSNALYSFFASTPVEYWFGNLTPEKFLSFGSIRNEEHGFYTIPVWVRRLIPVGTTVYFEDYLTDETGKVIIGEDGEGVLGEHSKLLEDDINLIMEADAYKNLQYGIKF